MPEDLPIVSFESRAELRRWLDLNHSTSTGIWVRLAKKGSEIPSVDFHDVLEEGLCFGWSESNRRAGDAVSYLQRFAPRRVRGTTSQRNHRLLGRLISEGLMTDSGLRALGQAPGRDVVKTAEERAGADPGGSAASSSEAGQVRGPRSSTRARSAADPRVSLETPTGKTGGGRSHD